MFSSLQLGFEKVFQKLTGVARLTPAIIAPLLNQLEKTLIDADVSVSAARSFVDDAQSELTSCESVKHLNAEQLFVKTIHKNLTKLLGTDKSNLILHARPPSVIFLVGSQGSGKTTSAAKLAFRLKNEGKKVRLASVDFYRPAALEQLSQLAQTVNVEFFDQPKPANLNLNAVLNYAYAAYEESVDKKDDVLILDTAGRLHIDDILMNELNALQKKLRPSEILLVIDSMLGQDAVNTAKNFKQCLPISGAILTKLDSDARGGAALSLVKAANIHIKFVGVGEKWTNFEIFYPDRLSQRILGMGDMLSLIDNIEESFQQKFLEKLQGKQSFNLNDFWAQLQQIDKMGGIDHVLEKLPRSFQMQSLGQHIQPKDLVRMKALLSAMTDKERKDPGLLKSSRKQRIAKGAGATVQSLNQLLQQFEMQKTLMSRFSKLGIHGVMRELQKFMR